MPPWTEKDYPTNLEEGRQAELMARAILRNRSHYLGEVQAADAKAAEAASGRGVQSERRSAQARCGAGAGLTRAHRPSVPDYPATAPCNSVRRLVKLSRLPGCGRARIAEPVPTSVCSGERNRVSGQPPGESTSRSQNNHGLAQHLDLLLRRVSSHSLNHRTGSDFMGIASIGAILSKIAGLEWAP
jgi:hypothetical protein